MLGRVCGSGCCLIRSARRFLWVEVIYHFQSPLPPSRPWWKLCSKGPVPEMPAIVAGLRNAA